MTHAAGHSQTHSVVRRGFNCTAPFGFPHSAHHRLFPSDLCPNVGSRVRAYRQYYSIRTHVQTVPLNPYSCTGGMTPSVQMYTPEGSTCTSVQPASVQMYSYECRAMHTARLCSTHHSRCTAVHTVLPVLCASSGLTFFNNEFRVKSRPVI
jgi:hypothetical protein